MAEKTTYEQKGTLREECMQDTAMPGRLPPLGERLAGVAALADVGKRQPTLL